MRRRAPRRALPRRGCSPRAEQDVVIRELLRRPATPARWPAGLRPALRTAGFADELRDLLLRAVERGLDGPALVALGRARGRADWVRGRRSSCSEYHGVTVLARSRRLRPGRADPRRLDALRDDPELLAGERERRRRHLRRRVPGHRPGAGRAARAARRRRRRAGRGRRPRPVDLRLPRRRRVGDPRRRRRASAAATPVPVVALRRRRRSGAGAAARPPGGWPRGCPAAAEHRGLAPADGRRPGRARGRTCSAPPARRRPTSPACCARAHLDGVPWSRMAVLVRSTDARRSARCAARMITAGVPVAVARRRPAAGRAAGGRACCSSVAAPSCVAARRGLDRGRRRAAADSARSAAATSLYLRRLRRALRPAARPGRATAPLAPALLDDARRRSCCPSTCAARCVRVAARAGRRPRRGRGRRQRRGRAVGGVAGLRPGRPLGAAEPRRRRRRRRGRPRPRRRRRAVRRGRAASSTGCPAPTSARSSSTCAAQQIPGDTFAAARPRARRGRDADRARRQGPGVGPGLRRRRAGGQLARPAPARLAARHRGARRRRCAASTTRRVGRRSRRSWPRSGGCSTSPSPGPGAAAGRHRGAPASEEQPSRFLDELDPRDGRAAAPRRAAARRAPARPGRRAAGRGRCSDPATDAPADAPRRGRGRAAPAGRGRRAAAPTPTSGGASRRSRRRAGAARARPTGAGQPVARRAFLRVRAARRCCSDLGVRDDQAVAAVARHARARRRRRRAPTGQTAGGRSSAGSTRVWDALDFGAAWFAGNERAAAPRRCCGGFLGWLRDSRARAHLRRRRGDFEVAVGDAVLRRPGRPARARRRRPAGGRRPQDRQEQAARRRLAAARRSWAPTSWRSRTAPSPRARLASPAGRCCVQLGATRRRSSSGSRRWPRPTTRSGPGRAARRRRRAHARARVRRAHAEHALPASATCAPAARCRTTAGR